MGALETLQAKYGCQLLFVESGGDNLAANYSRELADYIIYVIDVAVRRRPTEPRYELSSSANGGMCRVGTRSPERAVRGSRSRTCSSSIRWVHIDGTNHTPYDQTDTHRLTSRRL